jgi:hypothetical protein
MSKEFAFEAYEELNKSLMLKDFYQSDQLEKIIVKNYILSFYTIWETYAKKKVYDTYIDYDYLLHTEDFIKKYLKKSFGKQYLSNMFLKDLKDTKVKKDILCQSNNLTWSEFEELLLMIDFDKNSLTEFIDESQDLASLVATLKNLGLMPVQDTIGSSTSDSVKGYLSLVVNIRNTISHTYKMEIDEKLNTKQMTLLIHLFKCLIGVIEQYFNSEIAKKYLDANIAEQVMPVLSVVKGCNSSGTQEAILEVELTDEQINLSNKKLIIQSSSNKGYCDITGIRIGDVKLRKLPLRRTCTISVRPTIKIRKSGQYHLCIGVQKESEGVNIIQYVLGETNS